MTPGILTPSETRRLLDDLGHRPRKKLGQNYLIDGNIVRKSVELARLQPGQQVVEVGPGLGTLSAALIGAGVEVFAVERDPAMAAHLRTHFSDTNTFHLTEGDCVDLPLAGYDGADPGFAIVANLPYAVATPWLEKVLNGPLPERMVLMVQKEAADRWTAQPGTKSFGPIAIFLHGAYEAVATHKVPGSCFYPAPDVGSALLSLHRRPEPFTYRDEARALIRQLFTQRRKQLGSLCRGHPKLEAWIARVSKEGIQPTDRPEAVAQKWWKVLL